MHARFCPLRPVAGDGKTVGFVANLLQQMQAFVVFFQVKHFTGVREYHGLQTWFSRFAFGDTH